MVKNKTLVAGAVGMALGLGSIAAEAATITSFTFGEVEGNSSISGFRFISFISIAFPDGVAGDTFGATGELCAGTTACAPLAFDTGEIATNIFTTGFNFGGTGHFSPEIFDTTSGAGSGTGDASGTITNGVLDLTAFDFGGLYQGTHFILPPEDVRALLMSSPTFDPAYYTGSTLPIYLDSLTDAGGGDFDAVFRFSHLIAQGNPSFDGAVARWRLEGTFTTATVIPVPAAVWLFGSGLLGLVGVARRKKQASV